jgi:hypothetical protein
MDMSLQDMDREQLHISTVNKAHRKRESSYKSNKYYIGLADLLDKTNIKDTKEE